MTGIRPRQSTTHSVRHTHQETKGTADDACKRKRDEKLLIVKMIGPTHHADGENHQAKNIGWDEHPQERMNQQPGRLGPRRANHKIDGSGDDPKKVAPAAYLWLNRSTAASKLSSRLDAWSTTAIVKPRTNPQHAATNTNRHRRRNP
jgi:hypothetical protein